MSTQNLEVSGAGMTLEGWCVLAMGALFGLFLVGVWWELRRALRSVARETKQRERALFRFESRAAFEREMAREAASQRVSALRVARVLNASRRAEVSAAMASIESEERKEEAGFQMESVGRILERLAQAAPAISAMEDEAPAFGRPALSMVRGRGFEAEKVDDEAGEEDRGNAGQVAASRRSSLSSSAGSGAKSAGANAGAGKRGSRNGVKSGVIGSSALAVSR